MKNILTNQFSVEVQMKLSRAARDISLGGPATPWYGRCSFVVLLWAVWGLVMVMFMISVKVHYHGNRGAGRNIAIQNISRPLRGSFAE
jgi:hypothetical protein